MIFISMSVKIQSSCEQLLCEIKTYNYDFNPKSLKTNLQNKVYKSHL